MLLDTCTFLWVVAESPALSPEAARIFSDSGNEVFLSAVSSWEIAVKHGLGKLLLPELPHQFVPKYRQLHKIASLSLDEGAVLQLPRLPKHHADPFDRMLVCQAIDLGLALLTPDPLIAQYPVKTIW